MGPRLPIVERQPAAVPPAETPGLSGLLTLAVGVVVVAGLYFGQQVLIPITLSVLLSFVLAPLVGLLRTVWLGRVMSVLIAVALALGIILALGGLIGTQIAELAQNVPRYADTIHAKVEAVQSFATRQMATIMRGLPVTPNSHASQAAPTGPAGPKPTEVEIYQPPPTAVQLAERVLAPVVSPLATTGIVLIVTIFVLLQREDLRDRLIRLFGSSDLHRTTVAMNDAARRLSRYFLTQLGINTAFGIITGAGLFFIGVPSPVLWGIVGLLLRFVPYIGAPLAAALPVALAAAITSGWSMAIEVVALYAITEAIMGQVVEPLLYSHSTGLSPFAVVVSATFWTWLWGPIGLILSTPLTLCLVVLGRHVERLEFLDVILGDRPALTPVESFYQRMLAGDPDEAFEQAEHLLRDRALSSYYDEVALKGLRLAATDATRGVLTEAQLDRIRAAFQELLTDLDEHQDKEPKRGKSDDDATAPTRSEQDVPRHPSPSGTLPNPLPPAWRGDAPVLCLAGRGPLDAAACDMLAQLLRKHGLKSHVADHAVVERGAISQFDATGIAMICLCYLELDGTPSHLRYTLRRLRQHAPHVRLLVGIWPQEQQILTDDRLRTAIGADYYTSSLRETVEACFEAARTKISAAA
jgi:predicted PurR-regulated permease PerM